MGAPQDWRGELRLGAVGLGLALDPKAVWRLERHVELVMRWNRVVNLTGARDERTLVREHVLDSLALAALGRLRGCPAGTRVVDVGSGAGFPGLVLAVVRGDLEVVLVEARERRAVFLEEALRHLALGNARVAWGRAEALGAGELREAFDVGTARAVGSLGDVAQLVLPLLRPGGVLLAQRGSSGQGEAVGELGAVAAQGGHVATVESYVVPGGRRRFVVVLEKGLAPGR